MGRLLALLANDRKGRKHAKDKHPSLLYPTVSDEEK
jgi:hypothetical protein